MPRRLDAGELRYGDISTSNRAVTARRAASI
jgi:hypothetical protein